MRSIGYISEIYKIKKIKKTCTLDVHVILSELSTVVLKVARSFAVDEVAG